MIRNIGFMHHRRKKTISDIVENKIIENNSISLEEILSEETLIDEFQNKSPNLLKYLTKEKTKQIIYYIIEEPSDDAPHDRGHKYPWVCTQLLTVENSPILKYLYKTNKELSEEDKESTDKMDLENNERNNDNKIELLDYLLTFLKTDKEPNYVLCGYFASIIKALLQAEPTIIINYFYKEKKECIKQLINYSYRESIAEILNKIFQYDINVEEFNIEEIDLFRMEMLEELFCTLDINMNNEKLDSIATLIKNLSTEENLFTDLLNNKIIIHNLITKPLKDINLLISDKSKEIEIIKKRRNFIIIIDIIINWIKSINTLEIDIPSTTDESEDDNKNDNININNNFSHTLLSYELFNILLNLIKINFNKHEDNNNNETKVLQCFDEKKLVPLGLFRVKIVELLGCLFSYFKNIPNLYDKILIESEFFENAINYLFEYEFNNIYQESLLFLFKKYLDYSEYHPLLSELLFTKVNLTEIIISKIKLCLPKQDPDSNIKKDSFTYSSGNTTNRGYISFLISLAYKINTIIGGDPMRINDTLSREGSISFINRAQPFVPKEEITKFYGMEENELYEDVSNDSGNKKSKLNCSVKCMEKYLNDNWNEFFYEYISDKIKLYETQLYKDDNNRDSLFRNPFILEEDDEKVESRLNNFGIGEDQDFLAGKNKKPDFNKILYGDADIDINNNNRFKMSMRLPRSNNNANLNTEKKRNSLGDKPKQVIVDEIDNFVNNNEEEKDDKINNEENEEKEEENPLDAFNKNKNEVKDKEDNDDPFANFQKKDDNRKISLISFRKKKKEEKIENQDDNNDNDNDILMENNNNEQNEEENPLDKLRNRILPTKEEKMDIEKNSDNLYDNNEDEDVFKNIKKEENKPDNNNNDDLYDNNEDEDAFKNIKKEENKPDTNNNDDLYDNNEDEDVFKNIKKEENKPDINNNDDLYDDNEEEDAFKNIKKEENKLDNNKSNSKDKLNEDNLYEEEEEENPLDKLKKENNDKNNNKEINVNEKENGNEEEDPFSKFKKEKNENINENNLDKINNENISKEDKTEKGEEDEEENPLDKFNRENQNKIKNDKEKKEKTEEKKEENIDDLLYETKEGDDGKEIEVDTEEKK